jgi:hypothetical protein
VYHHHRTPRPTCSAVLTASRLTRQAGSLGRSRSASRLPAIPRKRVGKNAFLLSIYREKSFKNYCKSAKKIDFLFSFLKNRVSGG